MSCTTDFIRWILSVFNFIFTLCGLGIIIPAIYFYQYIQESPKMLQSEASALLIGIIIVGVVVFVISFFGCCGAIKGNSCMTLTFAGFLLSLLLTQLILAIAAFVITNGFEKETFDEIYEKEFEQYWTSNISHGIIDGVQIAFFCCGIKRPDDYTTYFGTNATYPISCCDLRSEFNNTSCEKGWTFPVGCSELLFRFFKRGGETLGYIVLGIAGVEIIGIILALCMVNSIRNVHRRTFKA
ncbi:CD63 antigen-like [Chelonus insularis]|uniref:CD63 antigen-like n=1 Tax=Chelonus insularis TaxID=460826 RepID=UPI00158BC66A|nr:CD63 antigen-like [Chelonus insularis]